MVVARLFIFFSFVHPFRVDIFVHIIFTVFWFDGRATMSTKVARTRLRMHFYSDFVVIISLRLGFVFCWQQHGRLLILVATVRFIAIINDLDQGRTCNADGVPVRLRQNDNNFSRRRFLFIIFRICFRYFII